MSKKSNTKEKVFNIVVNLLTTEGEQAFTMDRLAQESGISRATLYRRFGGREAILKNLAAERDITVAELDRPDVRTRILQAAATIFGQVGFAQSTIEQIAQEANVGTATVYRHFGNKEKLVQAFGESIRPRELIAALTIENNEDIEKKLTDFAVGAMQFIRKNRHLLIFMATESEDEKAQVLFKRMQDVPNRTFTNLVNYFSAHIEASTLKKQNPHQLASVFMGMLSGITLFGNQMHNTPFETLEDTAQFIVKLFLNGIR